MHPVLARYLDPVATRALLRRIDAGEDVGAEHRHLAGAAAEWPDERRQIVEGPERPTPTAQSALLFLATHAALKAAREEPGLAADFAAADAALSAAGAQPGEAAALYAQLFAEEAFSAEDDPEAFDAEWIREGLRDLPALVSLEAPRVEALLSEFAGDALPRARAARALLEAAWSEGVTLLNAEHLEEALGTLEREVGEAGVPAAAHALQSFVEFLHDQRLMGPLRAERLAGRAGFAALGAED